mmetsp:Transcript_3807/g.8579  ORF Transcript_3807/g.8579 Transcript_3807/m.8579 type:complete len:217 (-) Transcript_3807:225-875(-)
MVRIEKNVLPETKSSIWGFGHPATQRRWGHMPVENVTRPKSIVLRLHPWDAQQHHLCNVFLPCQDHTCRKRGSHRQTFRCRCVSTASSRPNPLFDETLTVSCPYLIIGLAFLLFLFCLQWLQLFWRRSVWVPYVPGIFVGLQDSLAAWLPESPGCGDGRVPHKATARVEEWIRRIPLLPDFSSIARHLAAKKSHQWLSHSPSFLLVGTSVRRRFPL